MRNVSGSFIQSDNSSRPTRRIKESSTSLTSLIFGADVETNDRIGGLMDDIDGRQIRSRRQPPAPQPPSYRGDSSPKSGSAGGDDEFDPFRFGREPYILWVDTEAFKATTNSVHRSLDNCGYQKLWKFKTVERMKIFLKRSLASQYIRSGTQYVLVMGHRDGRAGILSLAQTDVSDKLGMLVIVALHGQPDGVSQYITSSTPPSSIVTREDLSRIQKKILVVSSWADAVSALIVWRNTLGKPADAVSTTINSSSLASAVDDLASLLGVSNYLVSP
jgi:hypothetical protein